MIFFGEQALDSATFGRANLILHFHGFDDQQALARFDYVAHMREETNDFPGHGRDDLLAALGFDGAVTASVPGARIDHLGDEFAVSGLQREGAVAG